MDTTSWSIPRLILTILTAMVLLASGCSEVEGPLRLTSESSRLPRGRSDIRDRAVSGEIRAPKGSSTVSLLATCVAGNPDSRAVIEPDDNGAAVLWEEGDSIKVQFLRDGVCYYSVLRTEEGGSSQAVFTTDDDILGGSDYIFFTPGYTKKSENSNYSGSRIFGLEIRKDQTAVPDGVMASSNLAFVSSETFENGMSLTFTNIPAMLRFRLSGSKAGMVKKVTLRTIVPISGMQVIHDNAGSPSYYPTRFANTEAFASVTLSGDFEAGKEYHMVLWPKELNGFEMEFSDDDGNLTVLRSSRNITFHHSEVIDFGTIDLGDTWLGIGNISMDPVKYMSATEGTKPVSVAVIPDGFRKAELPMYELLAKSALDFLFDTEPYKTYKNRFNAWILKVASNESGAGITDGNGNIITSVDNYFGTQWGEDSYGDMTANQTQVLNFTKEKCPDIVSGVNTIQEVPIIIIVNDTRFGGRAKVNSDGSGYCICPFAKNGTPGIWVFASALPNSQSNPSGGYHNTTAEEYALYKKSPGNWLNTVVHEFTHVFGRLADEYWNNLKATNSAISNLNNWHSWAIPLALNISSSYNTTPWDEFKNKRAELMESDSNYSRIGVFQGGNQYMLNFWRSEMVSGMMDHRLYFNAWSRYLIAKRIMTLSGDLSLFSFDYWLERDVTIDPLRDDPETRSDLDRGDRYYYIYPHESEEYFPPDAPLDIGEDDYIYVRTD